MQSSGLPLRLSTPRRRVRHGGFTLIEMLISITIGLGILAGLVGVLSSTSSNSRSNDRTSELLTNGRYALNSVKQELREAGFRGYTWAEPGAPDAATWVAPVTGCAGAEAGASVGGFVANIRQGVWGTNDANQSPFSSNCIPAANYAAGNDVLVVRRLAVVPETVLAANTVYYQSSFDRGQLFRGTVAPFGKFANPPSASSPDGTFMLQTFVYFIRPWTVSAAENPPIPALCRVILRTDGTMVTELVASGIERMQVQYGRLSTNLTTQYLNAGDAPLTASSSESALNAWDDVNSVRLFLLARNSVPEPGLVNTSTYVMGDRNIVANDSFRRQLFSTVVQLRN
jgi:type IV pilus assembly protein PilW